MKFLIALGFLFTAGCSVYTERAAEEIAEGVNVYCREPEMARRLIRDAVDRHTAHRVRVYCQGDLDFPTEDTQ